jgi:hypothetical protein
MDVVFTKIVLEPSVMIRSIVLEKRSKEAQKKLRSTNLPIHPQALPYNIVSLIQ